MIDLNKLIQIAPFPEDTRVELVAKIPTLSEVQKQDLERLSWDLIKEEYEDKISFEQNIAVTEVALGKKKANEINLEKIEENIFNDLLSKFENQTSQEQINEIRQKLQTQTQNPS